MKRLLLSLCIVCLLVGGSAAAVPTMNRPLVSTQAQDPAPLGNETEIYEDYLDIEQTVAEGTIPVGGVILGVPLNISVAQSFTPSAPILTRVAFVMKKNVTASLPLTLVVRQNLSGPDLAAVNVSPSAFDVDNLSWVEFDFLDIPVTAGSTYYLVMYTANVTDNYYFCAGSNNDTYPGGDAWWTVDGGQNWTSLGAGDGAFRTYGRDVPDWATGMVYGYWGINVAGAPLLPLGWFSGFSRQKFLVWFDGIFAPFNTSVPNATMALSGAVLGVFMLGGVRNLTTDEGAWFVGLGGINATTSIFYYRIILFVGPSFFLVGKYYTL